MLGMLYIASIRFVNAVTGEKTKQKLLVIGNEIADIERKCRWLFDSTNYKEFSITDIEKVREKVHVLSTVVTSEKSEVPQVVDRNGRSQPVPHPTMLTEAYDPTLYAVGIVTTMLAKDELHALRKVGNALIATGSAGQSHSGAALSADSKIQIEPIPKSSGVARARDVSNEINLAHFVRG